VAVTAYSSSEDVRRVLGAGFDRHVAKPADPENMLSVLIAMCQGSRQSVAHVI
jgi:CheY-like chemotaxis protein